MAVATSLVINARTRAAHDMRLGVDSATGVTVPELPNELQVAASPVRPVSKVMASDVNSMPEKWRSATQVEAAEILIASNPAMLEHRKEGKRAVSQVGEQTLRQIRWAAALLQKSMNPDGPAAGIRPFWTCTFDDIVILDSWFDKLPVTCGKSPRDRDPETSLQAIRNRALDRIDEGELEANVIGLGIVDKA